MSIPNENAPQLSVVLATYDRADTLRRTLDHLAQQDLEAGTFEVIVIDDGSPDHTLQVVEDMRRHLPFPMVYMHHENQGPGYTQNRGIRAARAPILLLMADDIFFSPGALRAHVTMHHQHPAPEIAVLGKVLQSPELNHTVFLKHWDPFQMRKLEGQNELPYFMFWACNISVKRDFLLQHGLFREPKGRGGAAAHEDVELGYRLSQHGLRILYWHDAWAYHYHAYTLDQAINRYYQRGLNWDEFRTFVSDPEFLIASHLLTWHTLPEYIRALRGPNLLFAWEKSLAVHVLRCVVRTVLFNRLTVPVFWRPLLNRAERSTWLGALMHARVYSAFLFYHFARGVRDAKHMYSSASTTSSA